MGAFRNISNGPRGAYLKGQLVMAEPGATIEADDAPEEWFSPEDGDAGEPGPLDGSIEQLTEHVAALADLAEVEALIAAETAGKSRKGALAVLEARKAELAAA